MELRRPESNAVRSLGFALAALTVALPLAIGLVAPDHTDALVPLALVLPFVTMGALEAAGRKDRLSHR